MAQNPVIRRFGRESGGTNPPPSVVDLQKMYEQPSYAGPHPGSEGYMTLDAVVQRTAAMLATVFVAGAVAWAVLPDNLFLPALIIGAVGGFALGLYMSFSMKVNAANAVLYSVFEGVFLGAISKVFEQRFPGIVIQAVAGTAMVAAGMLFIYKIGAIRVTPRFTRVVVGATIGVFGLMLVNLVAYAFVPNGLDLRSGGPIAVVFSLLCIAIASFNLVLDFDMIERGIRNGAPATFAWYAAFGLTVTLIWLYLEILRLLGYARR